MEQHQIEPQRRQSERDTVYVLLYEHINMHESSSLNAKSIRLALTLTQIKKLYVHTSGSAQYLIYILRTDQEILPILPLMYQLLISTQRLPHIKRILSARHPRRIITIITHHASKHGVPICTTLVFPHETHILKIHTYPIPLYISTAILFPARTYRSTNHASLISDARSSASVNRRAWPRRRQAGATVSTVMWPCQGV